MSCNGCRVLRKGCSEDCMLRDCLTWIQNPQAQANATVFVTKFFGRATLMSFLSPVHPNQRSCLFQSLMYEAVGRTINPVNGAVGLLWTGKWQFCQLGVEQVLRGNGGALTALPDQLLGVDHDSSSIHHQYHQQQSGLMSYSRVVKNQAEKQRAGTHESEESESSTLGSRTRTEDCSYVYANSQTQRNQLLTLFL
ncbi:putative transcription factor AS2-LOB family [Medicago truncatula]|uniref:LOB domain protein n=2 Tax=Medicago truncatula TaxID=3880 RepID=G7IE59_MEDTR|nr:LOB domain-containing protein 38 [Medicago truncatula]AES62729.1 LOB domain protein [Medicago truncatula]RHN82207.1 putative transcription factor AS2-LOB family [Medicago truncatula]